MAPITRWHRTTISRIWNLVAVRIVPTRMDPIRSTGKLRHLLRVLCIPRPHDKCTNSHWLRHFHAANMSPPSLRRRSHKRTNSTCERQVVTVWPGRFRNCSTQQRPFASLDGDTIRTVVVRGVALHARGFLIASASSMGLCLNHTAPRASPDSRRQCHSPCSALSR